MYRELPISEERLAELREPLAYETNMVLDLFLSKLDGTEKDEEELHEIGALAHNLPEEERAKLHDVNVEIMKAYDRRLKREEAIIDLGERAQRDLKRAEEIDPSVDSFSDARQVLLENGITPQTTEDDLDVEIEIEIPPEEEWVSMPVSEIPTDENGIPTKAAARQGWGLKLIDKEGNEKTVKLNAQETTAMRLLAQQQPFEGFFERQGLDPKEVYVSYYKQLWEIPDMIEELAQEQATKLAQATVYRSYMGALVEMVKSIDNLQGFIDVAKGKDTAAARRYKEELRPIFDKIADEYEQELIERGVFELVVRDGKEYFKPGPNYAEWEREMEARGGR